MQLLGFHDYVEQGKNLAKVLGISYQEIAVHHFPDGESKVTLPVELNDEIILCRSLDQPNSKLIELFLACSAARQHGVQHITLVAPYLCYMRQDIEFHPGEVVSQKIIGQWLSDMVDTLITVDPHLHRTKNLADVFPNTKTITLSGTPLMAEFLRKQPSPPLLLGPDEESQQWVEQIAKLSGLDWGVANKVRLNDRQVQTHLPALNFNGRTITIIDDMASTGHTLANTTKLLKQAGAKTINCLVTHPLFMDDAEQTLTNAGIHHIWSCDSISHKSNIIPLAEMIAAAIRGN